jgi:hypothetical protein
MWQFEALIDLYMGRGEINGERAWLVMERASATAAGFARKRVEQAGSSQLPARDAVLMMTMIG